MWVALISALGAIFLAVFTSRFQHRNWKQQDDVRVREKALNSALSVVYELSDILGRRVYRQKRYLWSLNGDLGDGQEIDRVEYRRILLEWNDKFGSIKTKLLFSFGDNVVMRLEGDIQSRFVNAHNMIENIKKVVDKKTRKEEIEKVQSILDFLGKETSHFCQDLLNRATDMKIEKFHKLYEIELSNRDNLSCFYLLKRLFGIVV